jgi:uncharacterized lipoprotein YajG
VAETANAFAARARKSVYGGLQTVNLKQRIAILSASIAVWGMVSGCFSYKKTVETTPSEPVVTTAPAATSSTTTTTTSDNGTVEKQKTTTYAVTP